jgi:hypothetical protein
MEIDTEDTILLLVTGFLITVILFIPVYLFILQPDVSLNQETADEVCQNLLNNETAFAVDWKDLTQEERSIRDTGKLFCQLPSFDATKNIVVKR